MRLLLPTFALLLAAVAASADPPSAAEKLVRQLGDAEPAVREKAAFELRGLAKDAVEALEAGLKDDDAEIRRAAGELLAAIKADRGPRVEGFLSGDDKDAASFPGWLAFKKIAGDDRAVRVAYHDLLLANPGLFEKLDKDPKQLTGKTAELCMAIWNRQGPRQANVNRTEEILTALVAAAMEPNLSQEAFNPFTTMLYQPDVRELVSRNAMARRLVMRVLAARADGDPNQLLQTAYLANNLNLADYIHGTLTPAVLKLVESLGDNPTDMNKVNLVVNLVQAAGLGPALRGKLTPLVRKLADAAAKSIENGTAFNDSNALYQATNACQSLGLSAVADEVLRPAVRQMLRTVADKPDDFNRYHQALNFARQLQMDADVTQILQPVVVRLVAEVARKPDDGFQENRFQQAYQLARQLNLNEAIEGALRPAARQRIVAMLEQPPDFNRLTQAIYQARNLELTDLLQDTLTPVFKKHATALLAEQPDFNKLQQMYYLAMNLGGGNVLEEAIKPAFARQIKAMEARPINDPNLQQCLYMAKQVGLTTEVLPVARRAALAKEVTGYVRGTAILLVVEFGTKDDLAALEPLLTDKTNIGSMGLNRTTLKAEVRDVVLGGLVFKRGKNLGAFGFPYFQVIQVRPFDTNASAMGFSTEEERQAVFKKWEALKAEKNEDDK